MTQEFGEETTLRAVEWKRFVRAPDAPCRSVGAMALVGVVLGLLPMNRKRQR